MASKRSVHFFAFVFSGVLLSGCGGSSSSSPTTTTPDPTPEPTPNNSPVAVITLPPANSANNDNKYIGLHSYQLSSQDSSDSDGSINSYQWSQTSGESIIEGPSDQSTLNIKPLNLDASYKFELTVTDNQGATHKVQTTIESTPYYLKLVGDRLSYCAMVATPQGNTVECFKPEVATQFDHEVPTLTNVTDIISAGYGYCTESDEGAFCWGTDPYNMTNDMGEISTVENLVKTINGACQLQNNQVTCWPNPSHLDEHEFDFEPLSNPVAIAGDQEQICAIDDNGLSCIHVHPQARPFIHMPELSNPTAIYGSSHFGFCASDDNGLTCWYPPIFGEYFNFPQLTNVIKVRAGMSSFCASYIDDNNQRQFNCFDYETGETLELAAGFDKAQDFVFDDSSHCIISDRGISCVADYYYGSLNSPQFDEVLSLSSSSNTSCALGKIDEASQIQCWGRGLIIEPVGFPSNDTPALTNPSFIDTGNQVACAIDDNGPKCWGSNIISSEYDAPIELPADWQNATAVTSSYNSICALLDGQVDCIGRSNYYQELDVPALNNPTQIISTASFHCAKDDTGLVCWNTLWGEPLNAPTLTNPEYMHASGGNACAIDNGLVHCFGQYKDMVTPPVTLSNPTKVSVSATHACALDDNGLTCWGDNHMGQLEVPQLHNPTEVLTMHNTSCAVDENGDDSEIVCWGWQGFGGTFKTP